MQKDLDMEVTEARAARIGEILLRLYAHQLGVDINYQIIRCSDDEVILEGDTRVMIKG